MIRIVEDFPGVIQLETSVKCNARCIICPGQYLEREDMTLEFAKSIIDQCVGRDVRVIHPFGYAEPLVWEHFMPFVAYTREKLPATQVTLYTNAALLDEETAQKLIDLQIAHITFSIDGATAEFYEVQRPPLKFDTVIANVLRFLELNVNAGNRVGTRAHITFTERNRHEVPAFYKFWWDRVDEVSDRECDSRTEQFGGEPRCYTGCASAIPCAQPFSGMYIWCNGEVGICCLDSKPETSMGNLHEQSLAQVWSGEPLSNVRLLHNDGQKSQIPLCSTCSVMM